MAKSAPATKTRETYDVHPGVAMIQKWIAELKEKTGHTRDEWIALIRNAKHKTAAQARDWLKKEHGLGTNSTWYLADYVFADPDAPTEDTPENYLKAAARYVAELYADAKAGLKPLHDRLIRIGRALGNDVKVCPCKTVVPLYRKHVFAQIKPTTRTRVDFGLALGPLMGKKQLPARLVDTGGFKKKDRITHRIALTSVDEIDGEVEIWLAKAYELDK